MSSFSSANESFKSFPSRASNSSLSSSNPSPNRHRSVSKITNHEGGEEETGFEWDRQQVLCSLEFGFTKESSSARELVCANALAFGMPRCEPGEELELLKHVRTISDPFALEGVTRIYEEWQDVKVRLEDIVQLPMFTSQFVSEGGMRSLHSDGLEIEQFLQDIAPTGNHAILTNEHESATVISLPTPSSLPSPSISRLSTSPYTERRRNERIMPFIIFTPQTQSLHTKGTNQRATFRYYPTLSSTTKCIGDIFGPGAEIQACIVERVNEFHRLAAEHETSIPSTLSSVYMANLSLLNSEMRIRDLTSDASRDEEQLNKWKRAISAEETKIANARAAKENLDVDIRLLELELDQLQAQVGAQLNRKVYESPVPDRMELDEPFGPGRGMLDDHDDWIREPPSRAVGELPVQRKGTTSFRSLAADFIRAPFASSSSNGPPPASASASTSREGGSKLKKERPSSTYYGFHRPRRNRSPEPPTSPSSPPPTASPTRQFSSSRQSTLMHQPSVAHRLPPYEPIGASGTSFDEEDEAFEAAVTLQAQLTAEDDDPSLALARKLEEEEQSILRNYQLLQETEKKNRPFDCSICADTLPRSDLIVIEGCAHELCRACVLGHVKAQIEEARWPIWCPLCPAKQEHRGVVSRWTAEIVGADDEVFEAWNRMELAGFSIMLECPKCKRTTPIDAEDFRTTDKLDCPSGCGAHWCKNCHREIERGGIHSCDGEAEFKALLASQGQVFRKCPKCGSMIEKNGGCDHMQCRAPGCGYSFSWSGATQ